MCAEYVTRNLSVYEKALPGGRYDHRGESFHKHSGECWRFSWSGVLKESSISFWLLEGT